MGAFQSSVRGVVHSLQRWASLLWPLQFSWAAVGSWGQFSCFCLIFNECKVFLSCPFQPFSCLRSFLYPFIIFVHSLIELELSLAFLHCSSTTCKLATSPFQTTRDIIDRHKRLKRLKRLHLHFRTFTSHWSLQVCTAPLNYSSYTSPFEKDKGQLSLIFSISFPNPIRNQWKSNEINAWCIGVYNLDTT